MKAFPYLWLIAALFLIGAPPDPAQAQTASRCVDGAQPIGRLELKRGLAPDDVSVLSVDKVPLIAPQSGLALCEGDRIEVTKPNIARLTLDRKFVHNLAPGCTIVALDIEKATPACHQIDLSNPDGLRRLVDTMMGLLNGTPSFQLGATMGGGSGIDLRPGAPGLAGGTAIIDPRARVHLPILCSCDDVGFELHQTDRDPLTGTITPLALAAPAGLAAWTLTFQHPAGALLSPGAAEIVAARGDARKVFRFTVAASPTVLPRAGDLDLAASGPAPRDIALATFWQGAQDPPHTGWEGYLRAMDADPVIGADPRLVNLMLTLSN